MVSDGGQDCAPNLLGPVVEARWPTPHPPVPVDVFKDHDGIVHEHPDCKGNSSQLTALKVLPMVSMAAKVPMMLIGIEVEATMVGGMLRKKISSTNRERASDQDVLFQQADSPSDVGPPFGDDLKPESLFLQHPFVEVIDNDFDTVGEFEDVNIGLHLHADGDTWIETADHGGVHSS